MINFSKTTLLSILLIIFFLAAGFFAYQWWQIKGELARQIEQNENLKNQIAELEEEIDRLQREIKELKTAKEEAIIEPADWKTCRNNYYGFEIDYPIKGWKVELLEEKNPVFWIGKELNKTEKDEEEFYQFYIKGSIEFVDPECYKYPWRKEIRPEILQCLINYPFGLKVEKEVITDYGVRGLRGKGGGVGYGRIEGVVFPLPKPQEENFYPILLINYDLDTHYTEREIGVFNKIVSSFRYIEK